VGIDTYDEYGNVGKGTMYNNDMHGNVVGWMCWAPRCAWDGYRNDEYFPDTQSDYSTNQSIAANPISLQAEEREYATWTAKLVANGIALGPSVPSISRGDGGISAGAPAISSSAWYAIVNTNSTLCIDASLWGYSNGTVLTQATCGTAQANQEWQFQPTDSGYYQVVSRNALLRTGNDVAWEVAGGPWATANLIKTQLWTFVEATNQQWMPIWLGDGAYKFVARNSSKCLDVPGGSSAVNVQLQQFDCNGSGAQSYTLQPK
jgi:hypothetical protein